ncbi:MAG: hypothetical protein R6V14_00125 [Halanaerobiales bacterium]
MIINQNFLNNKFRLVFTLSIILAVLIAPTIFAEEKVVQKTKEKVYMTDSNFFANIAAEVDAGVVKITTITERSESQMDNPLYSDPFFRYFFGDQLPDLPENIEGYESGFIVSKDGYTPTCYP